MENKKTRKLQESAAIQRALDKGYTVSLYGRWSYVNLDGEQTYISGYFVREQEGNGN